MKRTISALLILSVIILVGCQKEEPTSTVIEGTKITELRSYTEKSPNPMNIDNCKLDKSKETLESLTHVSKNRLFYMDYLADFPMQELWKTGKARYEYKSDLSGEVQYLKDYLGLLYKNVPEIKPMDDPLTHCSAFVCHNEKKELLFCHNMDGDGGSIIAVYQRPKDRLDIVPFTSQVVPYEYNSIENYYVNVEATKTYMTDNWQNGYSSKVRIGNLMGAYASKVHLVPYGAIYKQALECLQAGSFAIEKYEGATNWSCIYNPAQKTILFNMRNDMSQIYKIDFEADFQ